MSGDFEKNINHQLEAFQLNPDPQVWERVAAALPEKRRRRFAIWWLLPLAACLGGGIWLMVDQHRKVDDKRIVDAVCKTGASDNIFKKIINTTVDTAERKMLQSDEEQQTVVKENRPGVHHNQDGAKKEIATSYPVNVRKPSLQTDPKAITRQAKIAIPGNALLKRHSGAPVKQAEEVLYVLEHAIGNAATQRIKNNDSIFLSKEPMLPIMDSTVIPLPKAIAKNDSATTKKGIELPENSVEIKTHKTNGKNRKAEWSLLIGVGRSSLANSSSDFRKSLEFANVNNSGGLATLPGGQTNIPGVFSNPAAAFNGSAGIVRRQAISKHISWQAEVSYQFLTAKQRVGSRNDSLVQFDAFAIAAFNRTNGNSTANNQGTIQVNRVHRLQLAPGVIYTLNPQARLPLHFLAGITIAYTISNYLLLHDYSSGTYIRSAKLSNKIMVGGEAGVDVLINHNMQAGIFYQHDFTNVARAKVGSTFRWNQLQFRIGIPLSKYK